MIYMTLSLAEVKEGRERDKRAISVRAFYSAVGEHDRECPYKQSLSYEFDLMGTLASPGFRLAGSCCMIRVLVQYRTRVYQISSLSLASDCPFIGSLIAA